MPLSVLVVDDDSARAKSVSEALGKLPSQVEICIVSDVISAKRELRTNTFDLVIIDIALPLRVHEAADPRGGLDLLKEVLIRNVYHRPRHFVGLTAYPDIYENAAAEFGNELWSVIYYDRSSEEWLEQLLSKARHILVSETAQQQSLEYKCELCIVTALSDPELDSILRLNWGWKRLGPGTDATIYHEGQFTRLSGEQGRVIAARAPGMGMAAAAVLATKMAMQFRPRCLVMCGICAGQKSEVQLGDVIVANPSWDYGSGKHSRKDGSSIFEPAPQPFALSTRLRGIVERLQSESPMLGELRERFSGEKPPSVLSIRIGPLGSGAAVLADPSLVQRIKGQQQRKLLGIDMEAYGVMAAASDVPAPRPEALIIKGVSDYADENKDDRYRYYAAYTSAGALALLAERFDL